MTIFIYFYCLCPPGLAIKLNFYISKVAYCCISCNCLFKMTLKSQFIFLYFFYNSIILCIANIVKDNLLIYLIFIYFSNFLLLVSKPFQSFTSHLKIPKHTVCLVSFLRITSSYFLERISFFSIFFLLRHYFVHTPFLSN